MIHEEVLSSFLIQKRKSALLYIAVITAICCSLFLPCKLQAAADTSALCHKIDATWNARQSMPSDSVTRALDRLLEQCKQAGYTPGILKTLKYEALTGVQTGDLNTCRRVSHTAIPYCDTSVYGRTMLYFFYNQLANACHKEAQYTAAAAWYYKALLAAIHAGNPVALVGVHTNIGVLMNDMGKPNSALYYLRYAIHLARAKKMDHELGNALVNEAVSYDYLKQRDSCIAVYTAAMNIAQKTGNNQLLISSLYGLGSNYADMNQPKKALYYGTRAVQLANDASDVYNAMFAYYVVGNTHLLLHHNDSARYYLRKFVAIAHQLNLTRYEAEGNKSLGRLYMQSGQPALAANYLELYISQQDSLLNAEMQRQTTEMQVRFRTAEQEKALMQKELLLAHKEADLQHKKQLITIITCILLLATTGVLIRYSYLRKRRNELQKQASQEQQMMQLRAMIDGEEKERRRVARELHDDIGGLVTVARLRLETMQHNAHDDKYHEISQLLDKISFGVRGTAHRLLPDIILHHKLPEVISLLAEPIQHSGHLQITVQHLGNFDRFEQDIDFKLNVYRIVQELVSNILKHARATETLIELKYINDLFELTIEDNGRGYNTSEKPGGIGLESVHTRVAYLGGDISISSETGTGTTIYIQIDFSATDKHIPHAHTGLHS